jgi:hypothetical protein
MSAATATIITGAALAASAGTQVYAAKKGASTAKEAAATQSASADQALALQKSMYEQQQQNLAPYRQIGQGSLQNLGHFQSFAGVPGSFGAGVQSQYQHALSPGMGAPGSAPGAPPEAALPPHLSPAERGGIFHRQPQPGIVAGPSGSGSGAPGQMVQVIAPTGETAMLSPDEAQAAVQRGARIQS